MLSGKHVVSLGALYAAFLLSGCSDPQRPPNKQPSTTTKPAFAPPLKSSVTADSYVYNIAALLGLTADEIPARLGGPISDERESIDEQVKSLRYQRKGYDLSIEYDVRSRRVVRFFVNLSKSTEDSQSLLNAININPRDSRFAVEYLNDEDGRYGGILIVPDSAVLATQR
ncbi:hypothetical protein [Hymenobacter sp.]|uniref:hypothetical protein n=1 Tax=Hymenobacter sp. TaxID=1898978 RepID=UPI00286D51D7|nr:hypothetical protein [Hymenobacter sp.]